MAWLAKPDGGVTIGHGPFEESGQCPSDCGVAFYVQNFALQDPKPWKIPARAECIPLEEMAVRYGGAGALGVTWAPLDAVPFSGVFQEVMSAIHDGIFEKTVPVVTETGIVSESPRAALLASMARPSAPLLSYGWIHGDLGFAGATPELLLSSHGSHLQTMALAGTARSEDREVFAVDEKEIREHEYVAHALASKLLHLGKIERSPRRILDLGSIVHFLTTIEVELENPLTPEDLIHRLHPTPALGPLPRNPDTLEMLVKWRNRLGCPGQFGAPFGLLEQGKFDAVVAIRGIWWEGQKMMLPAGCGVIEASRLVNEWRELRLKREAVKHFLLR
jgi:menaquinone-specific isochorismate synthase